MVSLTFFNTSPVQNQQFVYKVSRVYPKTGRTTNFRLVQFGAFVLWWQAVFSPQKHQNTKSHEIQPTTKRIFVVRPFEFKQRMQNLVFPEGLGVNKEKNDYRTSPVFCFFVASALISSKLKQKKNGISEKNIEDSVLVAHMGIEPLFPG